MTDQEFIDKWHHKTVEEWWSESPSRLFWNRAYQMKPEELLEMSQDLLSIPALVGPLVENSSVLMARKVVGSAMSGILNRTT